MTSLMGAGLRRGHLYALVFVIVLLPSPAHVVLVDDPHSYFQVAPRLSDLPLAALLALSLPATIVALRRRALGATGTLAAALLALVAVALVAHPSWQGLQTLFRLAGATAAAVAFARLSAPRERRLVLVALALTALTQTALALAQLAVGDLLVAYEHDPLITVGPFIRPAGTLPNGFVLAGLALVAATALARPAVSARGAGLLAWSGAIALAVAPVGVVFSRAAALGAALAATALAPGALRSTGARVALAAFVAGAALPALAVAEGWAARSGEFPATASGDLRLALIAQTLPLVAEDPLLGVGPGRAVPALRELEARAPGSVVRFQPAHSVPFVVALEAGIPAAIASVALLAALAVSAWRRGPEALAVHLALLPYLLLDNYLWTSAPGMLLLGLWAGAQEGSSASSTSMTGMPSRTG